MAHWQYFLSSEMSLLQNINIKKILKCIPLVIYVHLTVDFSFFSNDFGSFAKKMAFLKSCSFLS